MIDLTDGLAEKLKAALEAGISDDAMKAILKQAKNVSDEIEGDIMYRLKDALAPELSAFVSAMAKRTIEELLAGNEDQMRRYLSCDRRQDDGTYRGWTGRSSGYWPKRDEHEWHPIIHGKLHDSGCIALRRAIVEAHRDLITDERIRDLEDINKSLVAQVNKANAEKDAMWQRVRNQEPF